MKPFDLEKALAGEPVVTRSGREVFQLTHFLNTTKLYPLMGVVNGNVLTWLIDGSNVSPQEPGQLDLFMKEMEQWVNVYYDKDAQRVWCGNVYDSEQEAKEHSHINKWTQTTIKLK
tara:strand:- start:22 stop:369 length:348 start_codon:yes stop_codon:yes gene_type:complete